MVRSLVAALALLLVAAAPAAAQTGEVQLGTCDGSASVRPAEATLTCAGAGIVARGLTWSAWGGPTATANGTATVKSCDPDCATGGTTEHPVVVTASQIATCRDGSRRYTRVRFDFPSGGPALEDPTVDFPCPIPAPRLTGMRLRESGHGRPGPAYYVRIDVRLRVCAPRQRMSALFDERKTLGGRTVGEHTRTRAFSHPGGCRWRTFRWKLRDEFFGVGRYGVTAELLDRQGQSSRRLTRRAPMVVD